MNSNTIGKIVSIGQNKVIAEIYKGVEKNINTIKGTEPVGQIGSFVVIYEANREIIAEIVGVEDVPNNENKEYKKESYNRRVYLSFVGEIKTNIFIYGVSKIPSLYSEINVLDEKTLDIIFGNIKDEEKCKENKTRLLNMEIGKSVLFPEYKVKVNIDKFFGFHFAILGNTGAGKSNFIARLIQNIFKKKDYSAKGAKIIVFDTNGEYEDAFKKINENNNDIKTISIGTSVENKRKFQIPIWKLNADDWALLLNASEKTQVPVLQRAVSLVKIFKNDSEKSEKIKNHILASCLIGILESSDSSPSKKDKINALTNIYATEEIKKVDIKIKYGEIVELEKNIEEYKKLIDAHILDDYKIEEEVKYSIKDFIEAVDLAVLYEGSISSEKIFGYTTTLVTRLRAFAEGEMREVFTETDYNISKEYVESFLEDAQIVNVNINSLEDSVAEVAIKVFAKMLLEYQKSIVPRASIPINLIIDEAHRYIHKDQEVGILGYNIFDRIAKEGRKFGFSIGIASQRPSELSKTFISQCSNYIILRLQNPEDLDYVTRMVPNINKETINKLTYLQTGNCLIFGTAINMPTMCKIEIANPQPNSSNSKISEKWYIE